MSGHHPRLVFLLFQRSFCILQYFTSELTKCSVENNTGSSYIESVLCGIKWGHTMAGIEAYPTRHPLVKSALEGAKRKLACPVQLKEPMSVRSARVIADHYASSNSLYSLGI